MQVRMATIQMEVAPFGRNDEPGRPCTMYSMVQAGPSL